MPDLPVICVFGAENISLRSVPAPHFETEELDCRCYKTDEELYQILAKDRPATIVSFGNSASFSKLNAAPFCVRRMWIHFDNTDDLPKKGDAAFGCFLNNALARRNDFPLVTVFTPSFKTGDKILRPFNSLLAQTYKDWEWVIMDDSNDDGQTFDKLTEMAARDFRIRVYRANQHSGVIGNVKRTACDLGRGDFLLELDHDDELTPRTLEKLVAAYQKHPEVGFVYSDFAECYEDGNSFTYGPGWGLGYGSYREEVHNGIKYMVVNSPRINAKTMRHIVAAPNHFRSWRKKVYDEIGGHNDLVHVADDYELMVRTFLATRMALIPDMCYVQYRNESGNASQLRNRDIQRLVRYFSMWYDKRIHDRLLELGVADFVWQEGQPSIYHLGGANPTPESHCTIILDNL
jgi:glycosyltransferase involved in cell wall biosynthesis